MPTYQAESFYRAKITSSITQAATCPITIRVSKLPNRASWLLTISPNTEFEEIVEYGNINSWNMTIDITKRWINPSATLLTTNWTDYNNTTYQKEHTQNDIIRWDVNHIHINQGIWNTVLATNLWVWISKLSVAASNPDDPIVVGTNDPRLTPTDASTSAKGVVKLSVSPVSWTNPIAVGDNDPRLTTVTDATLSTSDITTNNSSTSKHGFLKKLSGNVTDVLTWDGNWTPQTTGWWNYYIHNTTSFTTTITQTCWFRPRMIEVHIYEWTWYSWIFAFWSITFDASGTIQSESCVYSYPSTVSWWPSTSSSWTLIAIKAHDWTTITSTSVSVTSTWYTINLPSSWTSYQFMCKFSVFG